MKRALLVVAFLFVAASTFAKTGVVFIHGKGGTDLANPSVDLESRSRGRELHLSLNVEAQRERRATP